MRNLAERIRRRQARVGVIGLGYAGLPVAAAFAEAGFPTTGFDIDSRKVRLLNAGRVYIRSVDARRIAKLVRSGKLSATDRFATLASMDAVLICVPTPLTREGTPDLLYVRQSAREVGRRLRRGQLIVLESSTYPGTTREVVVPELEKSGLRAGKDFHAAYSPERVDPGNPVYHMQNTPRLVGGIDVESRDLAAALYRGAIQQVTAVESCEVAEAAKLVENIYRCVNIAMVNELKMLFDRMGLDVWEILDAAATKPYGFQKFVPGPGMGGHCIPVDPFYLSWRARHVQFPARFIELAGEINIQMPHYVVAKLERALSERGKALHGAKVLLLGLAYKKDIDDPRESPALRILELLHERGASVRYHDPHIPRMPAFRRYPFRQRSVPLTERALRSFDAAVLVTDHAAFDLRWILRHVPLLVDTRGAARGIPDPDRKIVPA